jgi:8-oxo-dGTP diphosphatase
VVSLFNAAVRAGYRFVYRAALVWWFIRRPATAASVVAVWSGDRVLLLRTTYRPHYSFPGGFTKASETAAEGAARELDEEIGLRVEPAALKAAWVGVKAFEHRLDEITIFEVALDEAVTVAANQREIAWVGWRTRDEALSLLLAPHVRDYLQARST